MRWHAAVRNFALCLSLLAAMSLVRHVAAGASEVEVEHVDEAEWAILEEAMLQAGAVTRIGEEAGAEQDGDSPGRSLGRQAGGVSDIEDCVPAAAAGCSSKRRREHAALTPLELKRSRGIASIYVTEICSQEWCETQLDFTLRVNKGHVPETTEMKVGRERHLAAELEVHTLEEVAISSREDALGLKLLNLRTSAIALSSAGLVREVPVFGWIRGGERSLWVTGVVDEMQLQTGGKVSIQELKTRSKPSMPSVAQQRCTHLQLMLYKTLWDQLVTDGVCPADLARVYGVELDVPFGTAFQRQLYQAASMASNLRDLARDVSDALSFCTLIDPVFNVQYVHQPRSKPEESVVPPAMVGNVTMTHDEALLSVFLQRSVAYWEGRDPLSVNMHDAWKCHYCPYAAQCTSRPGSSPAAAMPRKEGEDSGGGGGTGGGGSGRIPSSPADRGGSEKGSSSGQGAGDAGGDRSAGEDSDQGQDQGMGARSQMNADWRGRNSLREGERGGSSGGGGGCPYVASLGAMLQQVEMPRACGGTLRCLRASLLHGALSP